MGMVSYIYYFDRISNLFFLTWLIPGDGHFERGLSLALDRALVGVEG
jgi:hypothetical protein